MPYEVLISDAIKILGPAALTAYVAYKVAEIQTDQKIKEIQLAQDFEARKLLFDLLLRRLDSIREETEKLHSAMGLIMGNLAATEDLAKDSFKEVFKVHCELIRHTAENMVDELSTIKIEMEEKRLTDKKIWKELPSFIELVKSIQCTADMDSIRTNIFILLKVSSFQKTCTEFLIENERKTLLKKYLKDL